MDMGAPLLRMGSAAPMPPVPGQMPTVTTATMVPLPLQVLAGASAGTDAGVGPGVVTDLDLDLERQAASVAEGSVVTAVAVMAPGHGASPRYRPNSVPDTNTACAVVSLSGASASAVGGGAAKDERVTMIPCGRGRCSCCRRQMPSGRGR